ncbi:phage holin, LLH family [Limosilactobacillus pontis]|uniref:phage holin, LLH family n=1 Tax=Limosilactobacillus pontis TaxID=35787 RepID=UPI0025A3815C|nr:phage holin, LLH family [Limosilactobacillus pontis]MDM8331503.1 phage holin, LLH family [Limosilactobacillus pontis]
MKTANDIFTWIFQSGAIVWLFYFGLVIAKPWVDGKIKHAKTAQQRETWTLLEQVAMTTVNSLVSSNKSGSQKFLEASDLVQSYLSDHGINVGMKTVQAAVQAAYEKSPLTTPPTQSTVHTSINGTTITVGSVAKHIPAGDLKPASVNPADMPGAQKTPAKSKVPTNTIAKKGIPTDNLKDVAVQTPQPEPQGDDANVNKD